MIIRMKQLTEVQARAMTKSILSGVGYLHSKGIVHRDLKVSTSNFVTFLTV